MEETQCCTRASVTNFKTLTLTLKNSFTVLRKNIKQSKQAPFYLLSYILHLVCKYF